MSEARKYWFCGQLIAVFLGLCVIGDTGFTTYGLVTAFLISVLVDIRYWVERMAK
ncbi:hypothetical protein [Neptunomonas japonica]|uniref:hypothetical protein n=1 Tax=Neptunomonas japonica TaxID=417574 RepID=UPI00191526E3|nr:hypothetical protein [Neptunomonas japonica]